MAKEEAGRSGVRAALAFGPIGLILQRPLKRGIYAWTPKNSLYFAETGGEGVHFRFVVLGNDIEEEPPVIMTVPEPTGTGEHHFIVGENPVDFLCLGVRFGYFVLEQLALNPEEFINAYADPGWRPTTRHHLATGFALEPGDRRLIDILTIAFSLAPWSNVRARLKFLQERYYHALPVPDL